MQKPRKFLLPSVFRTNCCVRCIYHDDKLSYRYKSGKFKKIFTYVSLNIKHKGICLKQKLDILMNFEQAAYVQRRIDIEH